MTERLYYTDSYLREFRARVIETDSSGLRVYLDRTAFYPTSGGQPYDTGALAGVRVAEVVDEGDRIAHVLESALRREEVAGEIDWPRRFDHMQQHTGQHLLSAVFEELYSYPTVSFHLGAESSTIDIAAASLDAERVDAVEERCAEIVAQARPVAVTFEDAADVSGLRKESQRTGTLRIVSIADFDRSACGGTHVASTAETGPILIRRIEKARGNMRVEFVCGRRAVRQARRDYRLLAEISRTLSAPFERAPELIAALGGRLKDAEKSAQRLAMELATREGRELHASTAPGAGGLRRVRERGSTDDAMRARAQGFVGCGKAIFLAVCEEPPALLLAASSDSGIHAGNELKAAVASAGGRGGGSATLAQASVGSAESLKQVLSALGGEPLLLR